LKIATHVPESCRRLCGQKPWPKSGVAKSFTLVCAKARSLRGQTPRNFAKKGCNPSAQRLPITYGRDEALEIISGDGYRNLLRFEPYAKMTTTGH
jgi:hypothetical protein